MRYFGGLSVLVLAAFSRADDNQSTFGNAPLPMVHGNLPAAITPVVKVNTVELAASIVSSLSDSHFGKSAAKSTSSITTKKPLTTSDILKKSSGKTKSSTTKKKIVTTTTTKKKVKTTSSTKKKGSTKTTERVSAVKRQAASATCSTPATYLSNYVANDTSPAGFLVDNSISNIAQSAWFPPAGYNVSFLNRWNVTTTQNSSNSNYYLGYFGLSQYNISACAAYCDAIPACQAFNIYYQRSPVHTPDANCTNPASTGSISCALWGNYTSVNQAGNYGQYQQNFLVMIAGSNSYNKIPVPSQITGFTSGQAYAGALDWTVATSNLLNYVYYAGAYNPDDCAAQCLALTNTNRIAAISASRSTYNACNYYNTWSETFASNQTLRGSWCFMYANSNIAKGPQVFNSVISGAVTNITRSFGSALVPQNKGFTNTTWFAAPVTNAAACTNLTTPYSSSFTDNNGVAYQLACGYDIPYTLDLPAVAGPTFYSCFNICDNTSGCNGFAYGNGMCYLKNLTETTRTPSLNPGIDFAWMTSKYSPATISQSLVWSTVTQNYTGTATQVLTSIVSGLTAVEITQIPGSVTAKAVVTNYIDSGTAAISTAVNTAAGTTTVNIYYPTPTACATATSAGFNWAWYNNTFPLASMMGYAEYSPEAFKTAAPTATGVANSSYGMGFSISYVSTISMYGQSVNVGTLVSVQTFYIFAGHGTGYYTLAIPVGDDITFIWTGPKAVSGYLRSNADLVNYYGKDSRNGKVPMMSIFLTAGSYWPVRVHYANSYLGAIFAVSLWNPDGSPLAYSTSIAYDGTTGGFISPGLVNKPCNAALAPAFPAWTSET